MHSSENTVGLPGSSSFQQVKSSSRMSPPLTQTPDHPPWPPFWTTVVTSCLVQSLPTVTSCEVPTSSTETFGEPALTFAQKNRCHFAPTSTIFGLWPCIRKWAAFFTSADPFIRRADTPNEPGGTSPWTTSTFIRQ